MEKCGMRGACLSQKPFPSQNARGGRSSYGLWRLAGQRQLVQSDLKMPTASLAVGIFCLNFKSFVEPKEPNDKFSMSPTMRKTPFRERSKGSAGKMNRIPLRYRFRKITASLLNKDFTLNLLYCRSHLKNT